MNKPEILAPAGDMEKLRVAVAYGADAVYLGGKNYGLRAKAKNFDEDGLAEAVSYAHRHNVKVYVTVNIFAHNDDLDGLDEYFEFLEHIGADAVLISDPGIFCVARKVLKNTKIHISTQANNTNYKSVLFWQDLGAERIVLARELSLNEISTIREKAPSIGLETFVHGAMCISYSGRCLLSNYLNARDANKGECTHPCRFNYRLFIEEKTRPGEFFPIYEDKRGSYMFNSKDLCLIDKIPELVNAGIDSFKLEGRMKTPYYVAAVTKIYREAVDDYFKEPNLYYSRIPYYLEEIQKTGRRSFTSGFFNGKPQASDHNYENSDCPNDWTFIGIVKSYDAQTGYALVEQRNKFIVGSHINVLKTHGENRDVMLSEMFNENGVSINEAPHAQQLVKMAIGEVEPFDILRIKS